MDLVHRVGCCDFGKPVSQPATPSHGLPNTDARPTPVMERGPATTIGERREGGSAVGVVDSERGVGVIIVPSRFPYPLT